MKSQLPSPLKRLFGKIPSFSKSSKNSLSYLNIAQFLGIINDNVFKFVMAFLLIDTLGYAEASSISLQQGLSMSFRFCSFLHPPEF